MNSLIAQLKSAGENHEFYPTTNEIIARLAKEIGLCEGDDRRRRSRDHTFESLRDIASVGHLDKSNIVLWLLVTWKGVARRSGEGPSRVCGRVRMIFASRGR